MYCICTISSSNTVYHISGAGIYVNNAAPQFDDHPIANNGLILSASNGIEVNFISNSSEVDVGVVTLSDGGTRSNGDINIDIWRVYSPFHRPGVLRITYTSFSSLISTRQGIYTATIPDSNNKLFVFNVGLYPSEFNGELLLLIIFNSYMPLPAVPLSLPTTVAPTISDLSYNHVHHTVTCESTGSPATTVSWMKDGLLLTTDGSTGYTLTQTVTDRPSSTYSNVLTVSETVTGGVHTYTCNVTNDLGSDVREIVAVGK